MAPLGITVQLGGVPESASDDVGLQRSQDRDALRRALARLPSRQRAVLVLRYLEDLPDDEISGLLGCQPATVSRRDRGRALAWTVRPRGRATPSQC